VPFSAGAPSACRGGPTIRLIAFGSSTAIGTFDASQSRSSNSRSAGESDQSILRAVMLQPRCLALGVLCGERILSEQLRQRRA
jgi:hypothetical protein